MKIVYSPADDILYIQFSRDPVIKDVSHGWNVNIGYGDAGIVEITVLDAKAKGYWPIENARELAEAAT
jgi:hypothetical protein